MFVTQRSITFSVAALLAVCASTAGAQEPEATSNPLASQSASQSDVQAESDDDAVVVLAEPDFRVLNLPSTLRLPRHGSNFQLTHRFNGNLRRGSSDRILQAPSSTRSKARARSTKRIVAGAIVGGVGGFFAGGFLGAHIEGDRCNCDDPGVRGFLIGAPIGAVTGAIAGAKKLF
jgi:glucose/arabinose dehydrogenase